MAVNKLPESVRSFLRTGIVVTTPAQIIVELVLNSIDAGATSVIVRVDLQNFRLEVSDNGCGMDMEDIDRVGTRYMTSKCHSLKDLQSRLTYFGFRGEALASLREVTGFLTIESRPTSRDETYCKTFIRGKPYQAAVSETKRQSSGTTVTAVEFMYNLPVRRKRIKEAIDLEEIKFQLECIAVIHPQISIGLRNDVSSKIIMQSHKCSSIVQTFSRLFGDKIAGHLAPVCHELIRYKLTGHIGKFSHTQRHLQFIYVNRRLVLKTKLHKLVNALLTKSYILKPNGPWKNSPISKNVNSAFWLTFPPREKRNKFAVFVLNIECAPASYDVSFEPKKTLIEFVDWDVVLKLVDEGVRKFLAEESIGLVDDSPPNLTIKNHSQLSVIREMEQLEKECALASANMPNSTGNGNDVSKCVVGDEMRKTSVAIQGVHGLPAWRKKSVSEQAIPVCTISDKQQEASNPLKYCCTRTVTSAEHSECLTEDPFPTTSNFSDVTAKQTESKRTDVNCSSEMCDPFLPPPSKMPRRRFSHKVLSAKSTDSEDPIATTQQKHNTGWHANGQKRKFVDAHKNLNMTKGKLKNFSFNSRKKNFLNMKHKSKNFGVQHNVSTRNDVKKKKISCTLNNFSYCTPNNKHIIKQQTEDFGMEAIASSFSGDYQSGVEFSSTMPVSRKVSRVSTHKPPVLSKSTQSTQTENGHNEIGGEIAIDNLSSAVCTRDIGISALCETFTSAAEPKLISGAMLKTNSGLCVQKPKTVISDVLETCCESSDKSIFVNNNTTSKTTSLNYTNLPKSCLKNNMLLKQSFCNKLLGASKSVSFNTGPKNTLNANTIKSLAQDNRLLCSLDDKQDFHLPSSGNKKFYMTSSDFLHTFKAVQKKSVSFLDSDNCKPKDIYKNLPSLLLNNNSYDCVKNISNVYEVNSKYFIINENSAKRGTKLETKCTLFGHSDVDKSISSIPEEVLHVHDSIQNKSSDDQQNKNLMGKKTQFQFSCAESGESRSSYQTPETPIYVTAVTNISTDDEMLSVSSVQFNNLGTNVMIVQKETDCHSTSEETRVNAEAHVPPCSSAAKTEMENIVTLSDVESCKQVISPSCHSDSVTYHKLKETTTCAGNERTTLDSPTCNDSIRHLESCRSSTGDSISCGQICISPTQELDSPICGCDISVKENDILELSSSGGHKQSSKGFHSQISSPYFNCNGNKIVTIHNSSSSSSSHKSKVNFDNGASTVLCSKEGDSCNKNTENRSVSMESQSSVGLESHCSGVDVVHNINGATVQDEGCNTNHEISHTSQGNQDMTTSKPFGNQSEVLVSNDCININGDITKEPSDEKESSAETQISQTCYSLYNICERFRGGHSEEKNSRASDVVGVRKESDSESRAASVSSQVLIEVTDVALHNLNASVEDSGELQTYCDSSYISEQTAHASKKHLGVQNITTDNVSGLKHWAEAFDESGRKFYIHTRSGITSYEQPVPTQEQVSFKMTERYEFLPKGMSPILQLPTGKSSEAPCLASEPCQILTEAVSKSGQLQDELSTVKWDVLATEKPDTSSAELIDQLMCSADRRMAYCEQDVPNTSVTDKYAIKVYSVMFPYSLTKEALTAARVLRQVDKKLILAVTTMDKTKPPHLLVLFDQHAVHERIRVEQLFREYRLECSTTHFKFTDVDPNVTMDLSAQEVRILSSFEDEFQQAGLFYNVLNDTQIQVTKIPTCLHEREKREYKHGTSVLKKFLESLIKEQVDFLIQTRGVAHSVPPTLRDIINSEACKGALKFGHQLSTEECQVLVKHLALCNMPFHCAHGRPSVVPIADLNLISQQQQFEKPRLWNMRNLTGI